MRSSIRDRVWAASQRDAQPVVRQRATAKRRDRSQVSGKVAENFEEYVISAGGDVFRGSQRIAAYIDADGYWRVRVSRLGRIREIRVAHLVASAWCGITDKLRQDKRLTIWPLDGDASNHHAENLVAVQARDAVQFERDTRVNGTFDANQARNLRREWVSRQKFWSSETNVPEKHGLSIIET